MCPTVQLECLDFSETSFSHQQSMSRQIGFFVVWIVFLCPGRSNLIFGLQKSTPGGVGEPLCRTFSKIFVSRDQIFSNFLCKMSICENSLLFSFNSRIQIRVHFIRFEHCQVSICENIPAKTFIFVFSGLGLIFKHF